MVCARIDHRFQGKYHSCLQPGTETGTPKVGDLGIFMHLLADAMANVSREQPKTVGFHPLLYCCRYIRQTVAFHRLRNSLHEGFSGDAESFSASGEIFPTG